MAETPAQYGSVSTSILSTQLDAEKNTSRLQLNRLLVLSQVLTEANRGFWQLPVAPDSAE